MIAPDDAPTPSAAEPVAPSPGVLLAPIGEGAIACDLVADAAHVLDARAAWVLASVIDGPVDLADLVEEASGATGADGNTVLTDLTRCLATLRGLGLVDRAEPFEPPRPMTGSTLSQEAHEVGRVHAVLDHGIAFRCGDQDLLDEVDGFLAMSIDDRDTTLVFDLSRNEHGGIDLTTADQWRFPSRSGFYAQLPGVLNEYAARTHGTLVLHAGAVRTPDGRVVLVPGHMEAGKSTLLAAMVQAGCSYLGDESIGIRNGTLAAIAYPKPLTLDPTSRHVLGLPPSQEPHASLDEVRAGATRLAGDVGRVDLIVLTEYSGARPTDPIPRSVDTVTRLSPVEAAKALLGNVLNLARAGEPGLTSLCELAEQVPVLRVVHDDSVALARRLVTGDLRTPRDPS